MKLALPLFTLLLSLNASSSEEFFPPSDEDLMAVSFNFLEESQKVMSSKQDEDCDQNMSREKQEVFAAILESSNDEVHCICELDNITPEQKGLIEKWIGKIEGTEMGLDTGNDNFLHGGLQRTKYKKYDGDDRGRTFNGGINYSLIGTEGKLKISLDSTGFGKFTTVDGKRKTSNGEYFLNYRELNTLNVRLDKNLSEIKKEDGKDKTYFIADFSFLNETDEGKMSRSVQQWWHSYHKGNGTDVIQYKYLKEEEDQNTAVLMAGIGKEWIRDLGKWKCQTALEARGGMSIDFKGNPSAEIAARAEAKVSHSSMPWLALSTWIEGSNGFRGLAAEAGIVLSAEKKFKNVVIRPYIGIEHHHTQMDKKYGSVSGKPYENYHVLGISIRY